VGIIITYFFVPDMTGVDFADEDARFMEYLERNGWKGVVGEDEDEDSREPSSGSASTRNPNHGVHDGGRPQHQMLSSLRHVASYRSFVS
jgi:hypothetical protein